MGSVASVSKKTSIGLFSKDNKPTRAPASLAVPGDIPSDDGVTKRPRCGAESAQEANASPASPPPAFNNRKRASGEIFRSRAWFIAKLKSTTQKRATPIITVKPAENNVEFLVAPESKKSGRDSSSSTSSRHSVEYLDSGRVVKVSTDLTFHTQRARHSVTYTDTSEAWKLLRDGCADVSIIDVTTRNTLVMGSLSSKNSSRKPSTASTVSLPSLPRPPIEIKVENGEGDSPFTIPYIVEDKPKPEELCYVCEYPIFCYPTYPCRVCLRCYHENCLGLTGSVISKDVDIKDALTVKGWSCPQCENISSLLKEEEMLELVEAFDKLDENLDTRVTLEEFLKYQQRHFLRWDTPMPSEDLEMEKMKFRLMDRDQTGTIDWWEFLNYETLRKLRKRDKSSLVSILTENEIQQARESFQAMDKDMNGVINMEEAQDAFNLWYNKCVTKRWMDKELRQSRPELSIRSEVHVGSAMSRSELKQKLTQKVGQEVGFHVEHRIRHLLECDRDRDGEISWEEYLKGHALSLISARLNVKTNVFLESPNFL